MRGDTARGIRAVIEGKGLVQKAVAERAGFTPQKLNDMLAGRATIHADDMPQIAEALGVSIEEIFCYKKENHQIAVTNDEGEVIAVVAGDSVVEHEGYHVILS